MERVKGIEPSSGAWEALALPLSYTRIGVSLSCDAGPVKRGLERNFIIHVGRAGRCGAAGTAVAGTIALIAVISAATC